MAVGGHEHALARLADDHPTAERPHKSIGE
jgi:hypothetical protein